MPVCTLLCVWMCYLQEKEVRIRKKMSNLKHRMGAWEERSMDGIKGFIGMFGRDGRIVSHCNNHVISSAQLYAL